MVTEETLQGDSVGTRPTQQYFSVVKVEVGLQGVFASRDFCFGGKGRDFLLPATKSPTGGLGKKSRPRGWGPDASPCPDTGQSLPGVSSSTRHPLKWRLEAGDSLVDP